MARKRARAKETEARIEPEMTPMIDVIFQLFIFFMCTINFKILEGKLDTFLPKDKGLANYAIPPAELQELRIRIIHKPKEDPNKTEIALGNKTIATLRRYPQSEPARQKQDRAKAREQLQAAVDEAYKLYDRIMEASGTEGKVPVKLDPDQSAPYEAMIFVLDCCKELGIENVEFSGRRSDR